MIERLLAGDRALDEGRFEEAEAAFRQVADADSRSAIARVGLARVSLARARWEEARGRLDEALRIDPDDALARRLASELEARLPFRPEDPDAPAPGAHAPAIPPAAPPRRGLLARIRGGRTRGA